MKKTLNALLKDCKSYQLAYQSASENGSTTQKQTTFHEKLQELIPLLKTLQEKTKKENPVGVFNDLYNKNFAYLNKFTAVSQNSIKHILAYQQLVQKMANLYTGIPQETLKRQAQILNQRKKDVDRWLIGMDEMLQGQENQLALEKRFLELLASANVALEEKGMETISLSIDNSPTL